MYKYFNIVPLSLQRKLRGKKNQEAEKWKHKQYHYDRLNCTRSYPRKYQMDDHVFVDHDEDFFNCLDANCPKIQV